MPSKKKKEQILKYKKVGKDNEEIKQYFLTHDIIYLRFFIQSKYPIKQKPRGLSIMKRSYATA